MTAAAVELRDIVTDDDRAAVVALRLGPGQEAFVSDGADSLAEAAEEPRAIPRAWSVHDRDTGRIVGFVMISDGIPEDVLAANDDLLGPYFLWKLFVDVDHQRRGYGSAILDAVVAYLRKRPGAEVLWTTCGEGAGGPRPFYEGYGFVATGEQKWGETVLRLPLEKETR